MPLLTGLMMEALDLSENLDDITDAKMENYSGARIRKGTGSGKKIMIFFWYGVKEWLCHKAYMFDISIL